MDKYYKDSGVGESRTARNRDYYNKINEEDFEDLSLTSNISVLGTNAENLSIDEIKELLNSKYEEKKRQEISDDYYSKKETEDIENTKEYDLKKVLETAHKNKTTTYDEERFKKLRQTQFDILNSLEIEKENDVSNEKKVSDEETELMDLIKTVNLNAAKNKNKHQSDELLSELMESRTETVSVTKITEGEPDKKPTIVEELEKTKQLMREDIEKELEKIEDEDEKTSKDTFEMSRTEELSNSFYTGSLSIKEKDMDDFKDLEDELNGGSVLIKVLIIILVLVGLCLAVYLLNKYLNLGLF